MHPLLHSWRDELTARFVRLLAYVAAAAVLSIVAAQIFTAPRVTAAPPASRSPWTEIERPFPAFALSIPEAADVTAHYAIRRHVVGNGRKDILTLGDADSAAP
jgi:energy-converting hydrogenase Eha subunit A